MNRYAPELALIAGGLLGASFGGFVLFALGEFYSAATVCALLSYPFAAYAIHTDETPTDVLPPRGVLLVAIVVGTGIVVDCLRLFGPTVDSLLFSSGPTLLVVLPVAVYTVRYGERPAWLAPRTVGIAASLLAVALLVGSLTNASSVAAVSAGVVFVAGMVYWVRADDSERRWRLWPVGGLVVAAGLFGVGLTTGGPLDRWMVAALAVAFGPLVVVILTQN